ncbi:MAG: hypothetical protein OHK93_001021 [Ramalina farinacea]|uniref:Threonylcarbamoyl-AMP synthase n=1 Tax=Ramalina farinacea TaxID=258253 RepID=A0AA43QNQ4_9LECA|nr:hypothetical protein [Ramalina farinacea]
MDSQSRHRSRIVAVDVSKIGDFVFQDLQKGFLAEWALHPTEASEDHAKILEAAHHIRHADSPVAFPTETVYGLGADASRSSAVQGIYRAKGRPADNPLIVHISSLDQLRKLLDPVYTRAVSPDPIPQIYHPLIERFWPGPLTVLVPLPEPSPFAPEVTSTLATVGVRMPSSRLALALIQSAGVPIAAPSANASTKPSPTTAAHVYHDLQGRIELILDGGPCDVGVESTVVDGLSDPPLILRPGGVSLAMLRSCPGWESVQIGYHNGSRPESRPKAPGMKYKHYAPKARVLLFRGQLDIVTMHRTANGATAIGVLLTSGENHWLLQRAQSTASESKANGAHTHQGSPETLLHSMLNLEDGSDELLTMWLLKIGPGIEDVARGLFSALRAFDSQKVDLIFVECVDEHQDDTAAAVMNRLRKAAESEVGSEASTS